MGETFNVGTLEADLNLDSDSFKKGVQQVVGALNELNEHVEESQHTLHMLGEIAEALALEKVFEKAKEYAMEASKAFDENVGALRRMNSVIDAADSDKFKELAENLSQVSNYSVATSMNTVTMLGKWNLSDQAIAKLLPSLQNYAATMREDLPSAATRFGMAIETGTASARRLGIALTDQEQASFKAMSTNERASFIVAKLAQFHDQAAMATQTAAGAQQHLSQQSEELASAFGAIVDKPLATMFNLMSEAVTGLTDMFNELSPTVKTVMGDVAVFAGALGTAAIGFAAFNKTWRVLEGLIPVLQTIRTLMATAFLPITAAVVGVLALGTAYGILRNAMENKVQTNLGDIIAKGFERASADAKKLLIDIGVVSNADQEAAKKSEESGTGAFSNKTKGASGPDFSGMGKYASDRGDFDIGGVNTSQDHAFIDMSEVGKYGTDTDYGRRMDDDKGTLDFGANLKDWGNQVNAVVKSWAQAVNDNTDASMDLQEQMAKAQDVAEQRVHNNANAAGGIFTQALAGYNIGNTDAQNAKAMDSTTTGQQVAGGVLQGVASAGGGGVSAAANVIGSAATGNVAGVAQGAVQLLSLSTSFATIMKQINSVITILMQAVNPILNVLIPALNVVMQIITSVVKAVTAILTPIMAPIQKLITTIMLVLQPFIQLITEIVTVFMQFNPILKIFEYVLDLVAKAIMWVASIIINYVVNPIIEVWNALIDAIDDLVGWLGVDLSSLKLQTVALNQNVDAVDSVTTSMNNLDQSSQNIPEGFKVALSAYNASAVLGNSGSGAASGSSTSGALASVASQILGNIFGKKPDVSQITPAEAANAFTPQGIQQGVAALGQYYANQAAKSSGSSKFVVPGSANSNTQLGSTSTSTVNIQTVTVQATSSDLVKQIQGVLKNQGYLNSGTPLAGSTNRAQYGAA